MTKLSGWGCYPRHETALVAARSPAELPGLTAGQKGIVARGLGRAYGDAAIGEQFTLDMRGLDRMRSFDPETGQLSVEAGVPLAAIIDTFLPHGFFPPVAPGTKSVTIGGMIAADVHGKNHHRDGGFGGCLESLALALPSGEVVTCSPSENAGLFAATVGGMGLTGMIIGACFTLRRVETGWVRQRTVAAPDLDSAMAALRDHQDATYSVAWIDCLARGASLGRSLVHVAEHATRAEVEAEKPGAPLFPPAHLRRFDLPAGLPGIAVTRFSVRAFNEAYYRPGASKAGEPFLVHWDPYFFPLDAIGSWNRLYGRRGFIQHQCVVPETAAREVLGEILSRVAELGNASFLAVLKRLGASFGALSFPLEGFTLALDFPVREDVFPLLRVLDRLVVAVGGRLYLAKDARQARETFEASYPGLPGFRDVRRAISAEGHIASKLSERLAI